MSSSRRTQLVSWRGRAAVAGAVGAVAIVLLLLRAASGDGNRIDGDSVVMLGDSITAEGDWSDLFPGAPMVNEGHSGFTTAQLVPIVREVAAGRPRMLIILTGTNDIRDGHPPEWTVEHLEELLDIVTASSPNTAIILQTILPRADRVAEVRAVNQAIASLAAERALPVLDIHRDFDDGRGGLRADETYDGLHLTEAGYARWRSLLGPVIDPTS